MMYVKLMSSNASLTLGCPTLSLGIRAETYITMDYCTVCMYIYMCTLCIRDVRYAPLLVRDRVLIGSDPKDTPVTMTVK